MKPTQNTRRHRRAIKSRQTLQGKSTLERLTAWVIFVCFRLFAGNSQFCTYIEVSGRYTCTGLRCQRTEFKAGRKPQREGENLWRKGATEEASPQVYMWDLPTFSSPLRYVWSGHIQWGPRGKSSSWKLKELSGDFSSCCDELWTLSPVNLIVS